jgi:hypothetical protein
VGTVLEMTRALALAALAVLAACGSDTTATSGFSALRGLGSDILTPDAQPATPTLTRADVRAAGIPLLQIDIPDSGITAYMGVQGARGDSVTWSTTARETLVLTGGVVTQTRGLGADLLSAEAPNLGQLLTGATVTRRYFHLDGAEGTVETRVTCTPRVIGKEQVTIIGLAYDTARIDEDCIGENLRFTNSFWIDAAANVRQSVQWVSPVLGSVRISDLRE